jgi:hypothetical protein
MSPHTHGPRPSALLVGMLFCLCNEVFAQGGTAAQPVRDASIDVNGGRPLAAAVLELERRYGLVITYEDPPYLFSGDTVDITAQVSRVPNPTRRTLVPAGGAFHFAYHEEAARSATGIASVLKDLLQTYNDSGKVLGFRLDRTGEAYHIIPVSHRDATGSLVSTSPLLDATISIGAQERTALQMVEAFVNAVSRATGTKVSVGTVPLNLLMQTRVQGVATDGTARKILFDALQATGRKLSWRLLCDPAPGDCALNVRIVEAAGVTNAIR